MAGVRKQRERKVRGAALSAVRVGQKAALRSGLGDLSSPAGLQRVAL